MQEREYVGVTHIDLHVPTRRDVLLFDRIAVGGLGHPFTANQLDEQTRAELDFLSDRAVLFEPGICFKHLCEPWLPFASLTLAATLLEWALTTEDQWPVREILAGRDPGSVVGHMLSERQAERVGLDNVLSHAQQLLHAAAQTGSSPRSTLGTLRLMSSQFSTRLRAHELTENDIPAVPLLPDVFDLQRSQPTHSTRVVVEFVIQNLPTLEDDVPWEDILAIRAELRPQQHDLHRWMRKVASGGQSASAIRDELEQLLSDYRRFIEVHRLKARRSILQTIFATAVDVGTHLLSLDFGKSLKAVFEIRNSQMDFLEAKLTAPGRAVAYIVESRQKLGTAAMQNGA